MARNKRPKKKGGSRRGSSRSSAVSLGRLCSQVEQVVGLTLAETGEDLLLSIEIRAVRPHPDERRLKVVVGPVEGHPDGEVLFALQAVKPRLVNARASEVTRRRLPDLEFEIDALAEPDIPEPDVAEGEGDDDEDPEIGEDLEVD